MLADGAVVDPPDPLDPHCGARRGSEVGMDQNESRPRQASRGGTNHEGTRAPPGPGTASEIATAGDSGEAITPLARDNIELLLLTG